MEMLAPGSTPPSQEILQDRLDRERIARDEALLGACRYAASCKAVRAREQVLSIVAHELRNSLHLIGASAELVRDLPLKKSQSDRHLNLITATVQRMNRLVQDLLDVGKVEAGSLVLDRQPTPVEAVLEDAAALMGAAGENGIELVFEPSPAVPAIDADHDRIIQVLVNLIGNALKFTPLGGRIVVRAAAEPDGGWVRFSVSDTGVGIPEENMSQLFDRFWQANAAHAAGAGLGLAIVKGIVEGHGGSVTVQSQPGVGSTFHFTVPAVATP